MKLLFQILLGMVFGVVVFCLSASANLLFLSPMKSTAVAAFTPASITGLRVWYDLSDVASITKNGSNIISAVADKSGNGYTGTGSGSLLYVANSRNSLSVAQWNGTNSQIRATAGTDLTKSSVSIVTIPTTNRQFNILFGASVKPTGQLSLYEENFSGVPVMLAIFGTPSTTAASTGNNTFVNNTWTRVYWTYDVNGNSNAGPNLVYLNRNQLGSGNIGSAKVYMNDLTIGFDAGSNGWSDYQGRMGEIIVYDHVLTLNDQILLDNYLHDKWGFSDTPPTPTPVVFTPTRPKAREVAQRNGSNTGTISVTGPTADGSSARARAVVRAGYSGTTSSWQALTVSGGNVSGSITAAAGFYDIEIEVYVATYLLSSTTVSRVGIGDVFIVAGQSNSTNMYSTLDSTPPDDAVNALISSSGNWQRATDPVPVQDSTTLSSAWPALGDLIFAHTGYPVGFAVVGQSNTYVHDWIPAGSLYPRITAALSYFGGNVRALIWHQGENDASAGTSQVSYRTDLESIVDQVQVNAGRTIPFGVGNTVTHPYQATGAAVQAAQAQVAVYTNCFSGANTDTLGNSYRYDTIHFNTSSGRAAHAGLWYSALLANNLIP